MACIVRSILIGGEWHAVEDDDNLLLNEITATEQCDACGSHDPFVLVMPPICTIDGLSDAVHYECSQCETHYPVRFASEADAVFQ